MPVRKDYILRIIEDFFKFLAQILHLKGEKQYQQAVALIDEASMSLLHLNITELEKTESDISKVIGEKQLNHDQIEILAQLLKVKADIYKETSARFSAINLYEKSLYLFEYVQNVSKNYSLERINQMGEIKLALKDLEG